MSVENVNSRQNCFYSVHQKILLFLKKKTTKPNKQKTRMRNRRKFIICISEQYTYSFAYIKQSLEVFLMGKKKSSCRRLFHAWSSNFFFFFLLLPSVITAKRWNTELWKNNENLRLLNISDKFVGSSWVTLTSIGAEGKTQDGRKERKFIG